MLINFFSGLRNAGIPATLRELMDLIAALEKRVAFGSIDEFYYLSRAALVKDEK